VVVIPDRREKVTQCETAKTHKFKLSAPSTILRLQLFEDEKPFKSQNFELKIGGKSFSGTTDDQGVLEVTIPSDASGGTLKIGPDNQIFDLEFGYLQPVTEKQGLEARLRNLGFVDPKLEDALTAFQRRFGLTQSGESDQATMDKLVEIHDKVCPFPEAPAQQAQDQNNSTPS
jgi:hypothetical protein